MALSDYLVSRPVSVVTPVLSSLAGALRLYIESLFPSGYFADYYIDTELPTLRQRRSFRPLSRSQLANRKFPLLSVRTEATADESEFATGVAWFTGGRFLRDPSVLRPIIVDDEELRYAGFQSERVVMRFQISIVLDTEMKAREVMMYLRRVAPTQLKTYLNDVTIATALPGDLLRAVWADMGLDTASTPSPADVDTFHHYLRAVSAGRIERVINTATGRNAFAYHYHANPVMSITGLPSASTNREGNVVRSATVELPIQLDVEVPMVFGYQQEAHVGPDIGAADGPDFGPAGNGAFFSFTKIMRPKSMRGSRGLAFFSAIVSGDVNPTSPNLPDVTELKDALPPDVSSYIAEQRLIDPARAEAVLWIDGDEVSAGWSYDWSTGVLSIDAAVVRYRYKYHFGIYVALENFDTAAGHRTPPGSPLKPAL